MIQVLISILALSIGKANGFHINPSPLTSSIPRNQICTTTTNKFKLASTTSSNTSMHVTNQNSNNIGTLNPSPSSKFFNLEEMEDKEACTTEVFLSQNGSVTLTETNGPPPVKAYGTWAIKDGNMFEMTVTRTYSSGREHSDVGEFQFDVERSFIGELSYVGSLVSVQGTMHMQDEFRGGDVEVGFFSMIDTTDAKLGQQE